MTLRKSVGPLQLTMASPLPSTGAMTVRRSTEPVATCTVAIISIWCGLGFWAAGAGLQRRRHARDVESSCPESHAMGGFRARHLARCELIHMVAHIYVLAYALFPCRQS